MSSLLLLPVCSTATPRLKNPTATAAAANGVRWPGGGIRRRRQLGRCWAAVVEEAGAQEDGVLLPKEGDEAAATAAGRYDWREEWYPLYLSKEVPDDAALPLTVFDRQLVLYRDADGVLRCHEDRCPHRCLHLSPCLILLCLLLESWFLIIMSFFRCESERSRVLLVSSRFSLS